MPKRQLVAIVCLNLVGYSRLMGADEEGTLAPARGTSRSHPGTRVHAQNGVMKQALNVMAMLFGLRHIENG